MCIRDSDNHGLDNLISKIYLELSTRYNDGSYMQERCILAAANNDVDQLNSQSLGMRPGSCYILEFRHILG